MNPTDRLRQFEIFRKGSRTYFYSSLFFPHNIRADVFSVYAFVRTVDNFVDTIPQEKTAFYDFVKEYHAAKKHAQSHHPLINNFIAVEKKYHFPSAWTTAFLQAMEQDLTKKIYANRKELDEYTYGSAECIGLMMARMMGVHPNHYAAAAALGKSMQLINFLRDIAEDLTLKRQYIPKDLLQKHALKTLSQSEVVHKKAAFLQCVTEYLSVYEHWNSVGKQGFAAIPLRYRIPIQTATALYEWTACQIRHNPLQVYQSKIKPSVPRILATLLWFSIIATVQSFQLALKISRPRFWMYCIGPFLVGTIASTSSIHGLFTQQCLLGILFFSLPANFFIYGINDLFDADTDQRNQKKTHYEHLLSHDEHHFVRFGIAMILVCALMWLVSPISILARCLLLLFLGLGAAYSAPPFRWKAHPYIDSLSNVLYILPGIFAFTMFTQTLPAWWSMMAGWLWVAAMHLYSAIPDIEADTAAHLHTTAVVLGKRSALHLCSALWGTAATVTLLYSGNMVLSLPFFLYMCLPWLNLREIISTKRLYQFFPWINTVLGSYLFWGIAYTRFQGELLWYLAS